VFVCLFVCLSAWHVYSQRESAVGVSVLYQWMENLPGQAEFIFFKLGDQMLGPAGDEKKLRPP